MFSHFKKFFRYGSPRLVAWLTVLFVTYLLVFALVLEYFVELTPCPLCIAQRLFFFLIGLAAAFFLAFPKFATLRITGFKITAYALLGGAIAARQVWMQWYPGVIDPTRCGVTFGSFVDRFLQALGGTGDCAVVDWTFMTLSIAEWSFLSFLILFCIGLWFLFVPALQITKHPESKEQV